MLSKYLSPIFTYVKNNLVFVAWVFAVVAMLGSVSLSELWGFVPCRLCWYQRYLLISVIVILGAAEYKKFVNLYRYVLPLALIGSVVAFYHSLLQWGYIQESLTCDIDAPCALAKINWFGFITIPFMSMMVFITISVLLIWHHRRLMFDTSGDTK